MQGSAARYCSLLAESRRTAIPFALMGAGLGAAAHTASDAMHSSAVTQRALVHMGLLDSPAGLIITVLPGSSWGLL